MNNQHTLALLRERAIQRGAVSRALLSGDEYAFLLNRERAGKSVRSITEREKARIFRIQEEHKNEDKKHRELNDGILNLLKDSEKYTSNEILTLLRDSTLTEKQRLLEQLLIGGVPEVKNQIIQNIIVATNDPTLNPVIGLRAGAEGARNQITFGLDPNNPDVTFHTTNQLLAGFRGETEREQTLLAENRELRQQIALIDNQLNPLLVARAYEALDLAEELQRRIEERVLLRHAEMMEGGEEPLELPEGFVGLLNDFEELREEYEVSVRRLREHIENIGDVVNEDDESMFEDALSEILTATSSMESVLDEFGDPTWAEEPAGGQPANAPIQLGEDSDLPSEFEDTDEGDEPPDPVAGELANLRIENEEMGRIIEDLRRFAVVQEGEADELRQLQELNRRLADLQREADELERQADLREAGTQTQPEREGVETQTEPRPQLTEAGTQVQQPGIITEGTQTITIQRPETREMGTQVDFTTQIINNLKRDFNDAIAEINRLEDLQGVGEELEQEYEDLIMTLRQSNQIFEEERNTLQKVLDETHKELQEKVKIENILLKNLDETVEAMQHKINELVGGDVKDKATIGILEKMITRINAEKQEALRNLEEAQRENLDRMALMVETIKQVEELKQEAKDISLSTIEDMMKTHIIEYREIMDELKLRDEEIEQREQYIEELQQMVGLEKIQTEQMEQLFEEERAIPKVGETGRVQTLTQINKTIFDNLIKLPRRGETFWEYSKWKPKVKDAIKLEFDPDPNKPGGAIVIKWDGFDDDGNVQKQQKTYDATPDLIRLIFHKVSELPDVKSLSKQAIKDYFQIMFIVEQVIRSKQPEGFKPKFKLSTDADKPKKIPRLRFDRFNLRLVKPPPKKKKAKPKGDVPEQEEEAKGSGVVSTFQKKINNGKKLKFGDFYVDKKKLKKNIFSVQNAQGKKIPGLKNMKKISKDFKKLLTHKQVRTKELKLSPQEIRVFNKLVDMSGGQISTSKQKILKFYDSRDDMLERFQLLMGEMTAGNDNPEVLNEIATIVNALEKDGTITKQQAKDYFESIL